MSGTDIVGSLLRGSDAFLAMVPAASIKSGALPEGATLPAVLLRSVSIVDRQPLRRGSTVRSTERVAAMVRAGSYAEQRAVMKLLRRICGGVTAREMGEATNISVLTDGTGPDVIGPGNSFEKTQDLRVSFDADA